MDNDVLPFGVIFAALYQIGRGFNPTLRQKLLFFAVLVLLFAANITAMYFNATPVGGHVIAGVQGRYFISATILALILFTGRKKILEIK